VPETKAAVVSELSSLRLTPSIRNVLKPALLSWRQPRNCRLFLVRECPLSLTRNGGNCSINVDVFGRDEPEIPWQIWRILFPLQFGQRNTGQGWLHDLFVPPNSQGYG
jgi:hypothetical protein